MSTRQNKTSTGAQVGHILAIGSLLVLFALVAAGLVQYYLITHGVENKLQGIGFGPLSLSFPILLIPSIGIAALMLTSWRYVTQETSIRRTGARRPTRSDTTTLRALNTALALGAVFSLAFVLPYFVGSSVFLGFLVWASRIFPSIETAALSLVDQLSIFGRLDGIVKFSASTVGASTLVIVYSALRVWKRSRRVSSRTR